MSQLTYVYFQKSETMLISLKLTLVSDFSFRFLKLVLLSDFSLKVARFF